ASDRAALAALRLSEAQKRAATGSRSSANAMADFAKQAAAVTGITMSIQAVGGMADAYTNMQNKLVNLAPEMRSVNKLHNEMFEIANKTRQPVAAVTTAFQRFDMAMIDMGGSQKETLRMTETINKAIVVSGATATESAAGLLQLAQAFGS
uniref:tape measure protein n=1 Tax=Escherichia coli TaxID=562 RepID=UPI00312CAA74